MENKELYNLMEVCEILGLHINTIYRAIKNGKLKAVKIGREWKVNSKELNKIIEKGF